MSSEHEVDNCSINSSLKYHQDPCPGKFKTVPTKPLITQRHLSLAYSPYVAHVSESIHKHPDKVYEYTNKGNMVAVISNGTAVLGLGNIGVNAAMPVMEGKAVLFSAFASINAVNIQIDTKDPKEFIRTVELISSSYGGINLEDIKSPECFDIENELIDRLDIPIFHDDQHGTAITVLSGLINACDVTNRDLKKSRIVLNGPGAAGLACVRLLTTYGIPKENITMCDEHGVVYKTRKIGMNEWKLEFASEYCEPRALKDAIKDADIFLGVSKGNLLSTQMLKSMAPDPIVFAMANPTPEIDPAIAKKARPDAIIATGRSDHPNQINNVLCFPYLMRGALDVRAECINDAMKIAAAKAIASVAQEPIHDDVRNAYDQYPMRYGRNYIIPTPFDPNLIHIVSLAVAQAAVDSGVARLPFDPEKYSNKLMSYRNPIRGAVNSIYSSLQSVANGANENQEKIRIIFAEGEDERAIKAARELNRYHNVTTTLIGKRDVIRENMNALRIDPDSIKISNAALRADNYDYVDLVYNALHRKGYLIRDCKKMVNHDRNIFGTCMLLSDEQDVLITGLTRNTHKVLQGVRRIIRSHDVVYGMNISVINNKTVFIMDTIVHKSPSAKELAKIAISAAKRVMNLGYVPRVAFTNGSNFGSVECDTTNKIAETISILDHMNVNFEYDGEMSLDLALNRDILNNYPIMRLSDSANILIMPDLHSASMVCEALCIGSQSINIGPIICGLNRHVQIASMNSTTDDLIALAAIPVHEITMQNKHKY